MGEAKLEEYVKSILPIFNENFKDMASLETGVDITRVEYTLTESRRTRGSAGLLIISDVHFKAFDIDNHSVSLRKLIAVKFTEDPKSIALQVKNSFMLESKFFSSPTFGTPKILYASTSNPGMLLYKGVEGKNYDESDKILDKSYLAGKLISIVHGRALQPVDDFLYQNYTRRVSQILSGTGKEQEFSTGFKRAFDKLKGLNSGCVTHSDFHQSNVMFVTNKEENEARKVYIIDPEFMGKGHLDRMEDVGTFFGKQFLDEYKQNEEIQQGYIELKDFIKGYNNHLSDGKSGVNLDMIYPKGLPIQFHIANWALLDASDFLINRSKEEEGFDHPEIKLRFKFALYILNSNSLEKLSGIDFLK